jgi:putative thioredoxin
MNTIAREITEDVFATEVVEASRSRPVVVDFWAPWCGPCHQLSPILDRVAALHAGEVDLVKLNVDQAPRLAQQYRVQGIPAVKAFKDGKVVSEFVGVQPEPSVQAFFAALAPSEADRLVEQASADGAGAETLLRQALEHDPGHARAAVALASLLVDRDEVAEARQLLARAPADDEARKLLARLNLAEAGGEEDLADLRRRAEGGDVAARVALGRALAAHGEYDEALRWLVDAARDSAARDDARAATLEVFALLGEGHELVRVWRPKLAAALF